MFSAGVNGGRSLQKLAELTATVPAKLFGLSPRKGVIVAWTQIWRSGIRARGEDPQ
jgi:formylmethanofuran dehydrogenase subunit A